MNNSTLNTQNSTFKSTPIGDIPVDWKCVRMRDICTINQGLQIAISERHEQPAVNRKVYITIQSINKSDQPAQYVENPTDSVVCNPTDILMTRTGNTGIVVSNQSGVFHNNFFKINYARNAVEQMFLYEYLNTKRIQHLILARAGASTIPDLNHSDFYSIALPLPSLPEQRKIAEILGTWDRAIDTQQQLIDYLTKRKKALMQQLLTCKTRLPGFEDEWPIRKLGELAHNISNANKGKYSSEKLYGVNKSKGIIPMREETKGVNFDRCKIITKNTFAYNPMRINIGSIARWQSSEEVMVSGDYVTFLCGDNLLPDYLDFFRQSHLWELFMKRAGNGGVRIRIYFKDLAFLKVPTPSIVEQQAIAKVLTAADKEIRLHTDHRDSLRNQKRGLMQQLLTGKTRVTI